MLKSMTGYGRNAIILGEKTITIEVKCLNSKQLDLNLRMISDLKELEPEIRSMVGQILERGKIDMFIYMDNNGQTAPAKINQNLFKSYYKELIELSENIQNQQNINFFERALLMPDVITLPKMDLSKEDIKKLLNSIKNALEKANDYRIEEAEALEMDLKKRVHYIEDYVKQIEPFESERMSALKARLSKAFCELGLEDKIDKNRFEQELIYYLEKWDTTEEKVRLKKHCQYFMETIDNEANCGRKLGFIAQEIGREINTLGSKCNHSEIQKVVVLMKDELEKIKEQSLNIL